MTASPHEYTRIFDRSGALDAPSWRDLLGETRAMLRACRLRPGIGTGPLPAGDGHPVIVLPPFLCSDRMTRGFRAWLAGLGYAVAGWGGGINFGPTDRTVGAVERLLRDSTEAAGCRASLVGYSLGGVLARALASAHPDRVRRVITVCSPFRLPTASPLERVYRALSPLHSGQRLLIAHLDAPPPMPTTAIYTTRDGVVAWRSCVDAPSLDRENIAIDCPHTTMLAHPQALRVIAERLARP